MKALQCFKPLVTTHSTAQHHLPVNLIISLFIALSNCPSHNSVSCLLDVHFVAAEEEEQGEEAEEATSNQEFNTG
jgi:hypothetical protein